MRKHAEIPNVAAVPGWTRRAARFLALKALEKRSRERPTMDEALVNLLEKSSVDDGELAPDRYVTALEHCRARLSAQARELLTLRYVHDLSGEAIAAKLGRPLNTIYVSITRLHRTLGDCIRARLRGDDV
jgi:DNA-directed RNA polymerase specialized sigma24 family protein